MLDIPVMLGGLAGHCGRLCALWSLCPEVCVYTIAGVDGCMGVSATRLHGCVYLSPSSARLRWPWSHLLAKSLVAWDLPGRRWPCCNHPTLTSPCVSGNSILFTLSPIHRGACHLTPR